MGEDFKPKDELLKEVFACVRMEGRIPWVNDEEDDEDQITVDEICIHGKSWVSQYLERNEETGLWEWGSSGESGDICLACEPDCDCGKPHLHTCPSCKGPWPKFSEERLIEACKNDEDLVHDTKCPKCGLAWTLSMEEMKRLHPDVLAKMEKEEDHFEDKSYQEFAERQDAVVEALERAYHPCLKDGCPADVNYVSLEDGKPSGSGGPIHKCDFDDLVKRFPGQFAQETEGLSYRPEHDSEYAAQPIKGASKIGRNDPCSCGSGKKYKKCCKK